MIIYTREWSLKLVWFLNFNWLIDEQSVSWVYLSCCDFRYLDLFSLDKAPVLCYHQLVVFMVVVVVVDVVTVFDWIKLNSSWWPRLFGDWNQTTTTTTSTTKKSNQLFLFPIRRSISVCAKRARALNTKQPTWFAFFASIFVQHKPRRWSATALWACALPQNARSFSQFGLSIN